ncbi:hypothetical protein COT44_02020 [Candidatus Shapirobacteria bacterium CG08_land_8_20_14_0_20_39_18]|uniref:UDP-N-acetylmuramoyl-tripeptide--D-alanyl-D-alanine ligase n=1 Tax=Candidatus Shapirobacteria bacterium CG08_land_8_20_14_0_20_39_18 TaxID=1974883 RepID=A0A2M6XDC4_9BACT|nr:MAG: hypothetical protein COT44_02020 [Candidatus Shapirobacteria bacterium CG08_land_8_20_14_0_20_39_18]PIY66017.1 MAG: hypothetical protein COY91_00920 [Candidatus Shapirobacteria bacterium CG_4_10_14_0_8_um_filter_39_15]
MKRIIAKHQALLIHWWLTDKFPQQHIDNIFLYHPTGFKNVIRNYYRTWLVHPLKRRFAKYYLLFLKTFFGLKVIGITGSSGKTTTKEMLASILSLKGKTVYSFANIDPIYNIPATILRCRVSTKFLILEMGVEYPGEMDFYLWLAKPDLAVITNIYPTHTKFLKDINGVNKEKSKIIQCLNANNIAVLNFENRFLKQLKNQVKAKIEWFGNGSEIFATNVKINSNFYTEFVLNYHQKKEKMTIPIVGEPFVKDALAVISIALCLSINVNKIKQGLTNFNLSEHRMSIKKLESGSILVDDSYNNNPESAKKAVSTLKELSKNKKTILVFGDMLELGKNEIKYHQEIGRFISKIGVDYVIGVGKLSKYVVLNKRLAFETWDQALPALKPLLKKNTIVLIKGSRAMQLDKLVDHL